MPTQTVNEHACLSCGACCAHFRVSFYWAEGENIPVEMVEHLTPLYSCMKGTNQKVSKCIALHGEIGTSVSCAIYSVRSSTCKEVQVGDEQCHKARKAHHLIPILQVNEVEISNHTDYDRVS